VALPVDVVVDDPTDVVNIQCEDEAAVSLRFRMFLPPGQLNMIYDWQVLIGKRRQESSFDRFDAFRLGLCNQVRYVSMNIYIYIYIYTSWTL
jgi:hypothetical protein